MNRLILACLLILFSVGTFAQGLTASSVASAIQKSDKDIEHPKKSLKVKTWMKRGQAYMDVVQLRATSNQQGPVGDMLKKQLEKTKLPADEKALDVAKQALLKAYDLDKNDPKKPGKYAEKIGELMSLQDASKPTLRRFLLLRGEKFFAEKNFEEVQKCYATICELTEHPATSYVDTVAYYYAGVIASQNGDKETAVKYLKKAVDLKYEGAKAYASWVEAMMHTKDSTQVEGALQKGIELYPEDNQPLINTLIDYYLKKDKTDEALKFLNIAIKKDPSKHIYYYVKGTLFDKQNKVEEAMAAYKKTAELKPDFHPAFFNQGVLIYNQGRQFIMDANEVPPTAANQKKYDDLVAKGKEKFKECQPLFEKAYEIDPNDKGTVQALKEIYYKLDMKEKHEEFKAKLAGM